MTVAAQMLDTYPKDLGGVDRDELRACIEACSECAQACTACADACLSEDTVADLTECIRTNADCADVCDATGRVLSRHTGYDANLTRAVLEASAAPSKTRGDGWARHAAVDGDCRIRAQACRCVEGACRETIARPVWARAAPGVRRRSGGRAM